MSRPGSAALPADFSERGRRAWARYQRDHEVESLHGQVAAVDPESGRVWIGKDTLDAVDRMHAGGSTRRFGSFA